jgi:Tfp pilus assembly protein PilF
MLQGTRADRGLYLGLAQIYERGRRFAEAENAARRAESMGASEEENEVAWYLLGAIFERQEKYDAAEEFFRKVLGVNPRNAAVLNYYGYMLAERGVRLDEAVAMVERALEEEPNNGAFLDSLGWAYFKQNRLDLAEQYLRRAAERTGGDPTIYDHLGDLYLKIGRVNQAAAEWEKALAEWRRALPTEYEAEKVARLEAKLAQLKHRIAQSAPAQPKPQ